MCQANWHTAIWISVYTQAHRMHLVGLRGTLYTRSYSLQSIALHSAAFSFFAGHSDQCNTAALGSPLLLLKPHNYVSTDTRTVVVFTFRYNCLTSPVLVLDLPRVVDWIRSPVPFQDICPLFTRAVTYPPALVTYSIPFAVAYPRSARHNSHDEPESA